MDIISGTAWIVKPQLMALPQWPPRLKNISLISSNFLLNSFFPISVNSVVGKISIMSADGFT